MLLVLDDVTRLWIFEVTFYLTVFMANYLNLSLVKYIQKCLVSDGLLVMTELWGTL